MEISSENVQNAPNMFVLNFPEFSSIPTDVVVRRKCYDSAFKYSKNFSLKSRL